MNDKERERQIEEVTEFRFQIVAELANPYLSSAERKRLIGQKASIEYDVPGSGRRRFSEGCILKWLARFRIHGKDGLRPRSRRDSGSCRSLSREEAALLINHLEAEPSLTAIAMLRRLQAADLIRSTPSSSSLSRLIRSAGMDRTRRLRMQSQNKNLKFDFFTPLECVQADAMYSVKIPDEKGKLRFAILIAFIDDATRRVLFAGFSFSESSLTFEAGIRHILAAHGRIGRLYVDNGSTFVGTQTQRILATLGIILVHSRPGRPQGRGKVERFFRTTREQFFSPLEVKTLRGIEDLDRRFHSWLESEYHRTPHRGLEKQTPLEAWVEKAHLIIPLDPAVNLEEAFLHEASRRVHKDSTITLEGSLFEVPSIVAGERITVRYNPHVSPGRRRLQILKDGQFIGEARLVDSYANTRVRRNDMNKQIEIADSEPAEEPSPPRRPIDNSLSASRFDVVPPADDSEDQDHAHQETDR